MQSFESGSEMKFKIRIIPYHHDADFDEISIHLSKSNLEQFERHNFVEISLFDIDNNKLIRNRLAKCQLLDRADDDTIYLSSLLWFNLTNKDSQPNFNDLDQYYLTISTSSSLPKLINECHFVLVKCPEYNGAVNYDNLFKSFFGHMRFVELNDLIAISTASYPSIYNELNMKSAVKQSFIFFKCTNLEQVDQGIIKRSATRVYLTGSQNSHIPRDLFYLHFNSFADFIKYDKSSVPERMLSVYFDRLKQTVQPYLRIRSLINFILLTGELGAGKEYLLNELASQLRMNLVEFEADDFLNESLTVNETKVKTNFQLITVYSPCIVVLKNVDILIKSLEGNEFRFIELINSTLDSERRATTNLPFLLIATSSTMSCDQIDENLEFSKLFTQKLHIDDLRLEERFEILKLISTKLASTQPSIDLDLLARETNGLNLSNLINLFKKSLQATGQSNTGQLVDVLDKYKKNLKTQNHLPDIPNVNWSDVGGLLDAKKEIFFTIQLALKYGTHLNSKLRRSGLLFYGPPGTGKTLLAKAIATEFKLNFLSVKGPEIMNMYIGQSEENIRNVFSKAKAVAPSIIFFDELDSIARRRGKNNSSSGVMDRLVSTLLTELDSIHDTNDDEFKPVFVIGATNRPDLLDLALLRHGRFDKMVFIGLDNSAEQRLSILRAITRKFEFDASCTLELIEQECPPNLTGADFYGLCSNAYLNALERKINYLESINQSTESSDEHRVDVKLEDFREAISTMRVSISEDELRKYEQLSKTFSSK